VGRVLPAVLREVPGGTVLTTGSTTPPCPSAIRNSTAKSKKSKKFKKFLVVKHYFFSFFFDLFDFAVKFLLELRIAEEGTDTTLIDKALML
jgi:hypothetical protein